MGAQSQFSRLEVASLNHNTKLALYQSAPKGRKGEVWEVGKFLEDKRDTKRKCEEGLDKIINTLRMANIALSSQTSKGLHTEIEKERKSE